MKYKPEIDELMLRLRSFYNSKNGGALIQIEHIESIMQHIHVDLTKWNFPSQLYEYLDHSLAMRETYWGNRIELYDDMIPSTRPWFGIGELSAYVGGDVEFSQSTSWHHPIIKEWSDLEKLTLREDNTWFRMVMDGLAYLKEKSEGKFAMMLRGAEGPLDVANALRGNDFFMDMALEPENTRKLLEFTTQASTWFLSNQQKVIGQFYGGYITGFEIWVPGNIAGHIGEDVTSMCSGEMYNTLGRPYMQKLSENFDALLVHMHSIAEHNIPNVVSIPNVKLLEITDDPNAPRGIDLYKKLADELQDIIVIIHVTKDDILQNLEFLKSRKTILRYQAKTLAESQEIVSIVKNELNWE